MEQQEEKKVVTLKEITTKMLEAQIKIDLIDQRERQVLAHFQQMREPHNKDYREASKAVHMSNFEGGRGYISELVIVSVEGVPYAVQVDKPTGDSLRLVRYTEIDMSQILEDPNGEQ